jgi:tetratricopeptide (TPR) repeat protein
MGSDADLIPTAVAAPPTDDPAPPAPGRVEARPTRAGRVARLGSWALVLALFGLNGWWAWEDARPVVGLKVIAAWVQRGHHDAAQAALRDRLRRSPHDGEARILLARALAARGDVIGCAEQLHRVPSWWPGKREAQYREGQAYMEANRARPAEAAWLACLEDDPLHPTPPAYVGDARRELLKLYAEQGRWDELRDVVWRAYDLADPIGPVRLLAMLLRAELERIDPQIAAVALRRYVDADPDDWESRRALARNEQLLGYPEAATRHLRACLAARPDDPRVWRDWLWLLHEQGDGGGLAAAVARLPATVGGDAEIAKYRGLVRERAGDLPGAAAAYAEAARLAPFQQAYQMHLARVEARLGHRDRAAAHLRAAEPMRAARAELRDAYVRYAEVMSRPHPDRVELSAATARLADLCRTLGWTRAAEAWTRLIPPPSPPAGFPEVPTEG